MSNGEIALKRERRSAFDRTDLWRVRDLPLHRLAASARCGEKVPPSLTLSSTSTASAGCEGPTAGARQLDYRCPAATVRRAGLLALGSTGASEAPDQLLDELQALGVAFVSLAEGIDAATPAGKLQLHILGAIAEFERERIRERVLAGLQRARTQRERLCRPQIDRSGDTPAPRESLAH